MNALQTLGFFRRCEACKHKSIRVSRRAIKLPTGHIAISQKLLCKRCQRSIQKALNKPNEDES